MRIEKIKKYLKSRKEIAFAFLFGSYSRGNARKFSDIDIAVYFFPENNNLEIEENIWYRQETEICSALESITGKEIELVVLNRAPCTVAASALKGILLEMKDRKLFLRFAEVVTTQAIDYQQMLIDEFTKELENEARV
jgi:uncharacterized protein